MANLSPTIFREYDIRGLVDHDLTEEAVHRVGLALGTRIREAGGRRAAVGWDARLSGPRFARAMTTALCATGVDVVSLGVVPTPLTYFAAHTLDVQGICMITGSHNPPEYNGLKLGLGSATYHGAEIIAAANFGPERRASRPTAALRPPASRIRVPRARPTRCTASSVRS